MRTMTSPDGGTLGALGNVRLTFERKLPPDATVCVSVGDGVSARDVVARAFIAGKVVSVAAAEMLGVPRSRVQESLLVKPGDSVDAQQVIGKRDALFGMLKSKVRSPVAGEVESVSNVSGHVMIRQMPRPVEVTAYVNGEVTAIDAQTGIRVCANVSKVQGIFGIGGEVTGELCDGAASDVDGKIVCFTDSVHCDVLVQLRALGAVGVVAPSIGGDELYRFCGASLNLAATGDEDVGLTLLLTEGFGHLPMAGETKRILMACMGQSVSMCGITQVRAGVIRPELIGPVVADDDAASPDAGTHQQAKNRVKIVRGRYLGREGTIVDAPVAPVTLDSGIAALVYRIRLCDGGEVVAVPRVNVA